jgi:membrane-associated phospholipid phosphatase
LGFAFLVCFSRVYFTVHYPHDILAGALLGFINIKFHDIFFFKITDDISGTTNFLNLFLGILFLKKENFYINH